MLLNNKDKLKIKYGDVILNASPFACVEKIERGEEQIRVVFEGETTFMPKWVKIVDIILINGEEFDKEGF